MNLGNLFRMGNLLSWNVINAATKRLLSNTDTESKIEQLQKITKSINLDLFTKLENNIYHPKLREDYQEYFETIKTSYEKCRLLAKMYDLKFN